MRYILEEVLQIITFEDIDMETKKYNIIHNFLLYDFFKHPRQSRQDNNKSAILAKFLSSFL